jgi:RNA polymerase sigma-70 factor (ECF subfamily)
VDYSVFVELLLLSHDCNIGGEMRTPDDILDELLVMQCQDGDPDSMIALVNRWQLRMLRHALRLTGEHEAAMDVVQDAWLAIVRGIHRLDDPASFAPWAYRIVTNKCADWTRKRRLQRTYLVPLSVEPTAKVSLLENFRDDVDILREVVKQLTHEQQAILSLYYVEELSIRDIAKALSLPEGTVKSRLYYARNNLKEVIERRTQ